jgi:HSP20 family molecular chaperone IbpA
MSLFDLVPPSFTRAPARAEKGATAEPTVRPLYDVSENGDAYAVTVYLPGVAKENLEITSESDELRIVGRRAWKQPEGWTSLYRESTNAAFELVLEHAHEIDAEKIQAELKDGVLQLTLPKAEALKPRKIAVS